MQPAVGHKLVRTATSVATDCHPTEDDFQRTVGDLQVTGLTRIRYRVDAQGRVASTELLQSAGLSRAHRALDRLAERKLRQCREVTIGLDDQGRPLEGLLEVTWTIR